MEKMLIGQFWSVANFLGVKGLMDLVAQNWWSGLLAIVAVGLSMCWMFLLAGGKPAEWSRPVGGLALGLLAVRVLFGIGVGLVYAVVGFGTGMIISGIAKIPVFGEFLAKHAQATVASLIGIVVSIGIGWYVLKNISSTFERMKGIVERVYEAAKNGGFGYKLVSTFIIAWTICNPRWNTAETYFAPAIVSSAVGLVALVWTTAFGRKTLNKAGARLRNAPREDGAWRCENEGRDYVESPKGSGKWIRSKKPSRCHGPQGPGQDGWNPKGSTHCMSTTCDHPNPYWIACDCGYSKDGGNLVRRDPRAHYKCPGCGKTHPPVPKTTPFHPPGEDKVNAAAKATTPKSPPTATAAAAPTGTAAAPTTPCPHCGEQNRPQAVFCRKCRGKMGERSLADEALDEPFARN